MADSNVPLTPDPLKIPTPSMATNHSPLVSVVLPTFNERDNIVDLIEAIERELEPIASTYEVLVVDDNSPDGTGQAVCERFQLTALGGNEWQGGLRQFGKIRVVVRTSDKGLAKSIRHGLEVARGSTLVVMDTDFNHDPAMIPQMVDLLRYYDLVIGSRFVMRGGNGRFSSLQLEFCL